MKRRVVVTGMGVVSPVGIGIETFWDSLISGKSGIRQITKFDTTDYPVTIGGEIVDLNPEDYFSRKEIQRMDLFTTYAMVATQEAIEHSGLSDGIQDMDRFGVIVGSGIGGIETIDEQHTILQSRGIRAVSPYLTPKMIIDIVAGQISIRWRLKGPNYSVVSACASASHAIGDAMRIIQYGDADVVISGGTEAGICPLGLVGFIRMKALSQRNDEPEKASRPFDANRDGFVISDGAGILVLEEAEHALKRGANILGEIVGYGATADAYHITAPAPDGEGAARAMKRAIRDAGLNQTDVDYINAHGTSTPYNDKIETSAIKNVFADRAYNLYISSTKSMTGHLLGASGGIEAIASLMSLNTGQLPPTINYETPDPECDLNYIPNKSIEVDIQIAMSNSFGFGGHNAVLIIKRWEE
ncbi:MAG: beta-ketoacyl-ACP synthase II [Candidatus Marinimicrobia bacterium]|nr:beta-ketoacyl-ACP synthase II [Candidatus Neomarinimicrobiota bacterium]MBL7046920.1 beta-ketoacyl-ACP synthase II [Candidatus Neomarinimicrobiota bacterium]